MTRGDYSPILKLVVTELEKAKVNVAHQDYYQSSIGNFFDILFSQGFASNQIEVDMLDEYIKSFTTGSLDDHKNGSRQWVKNKGPVIET